MIEGPSMKVVVDKKQFFAELSHLRVLTAEYDRFLDEMDAGGGWEDKAIELIRSHHVSLSEAKVTLKTIDLLSALMRKLLGQVDVEQLSLKFGPKSGEAAAGKSRSGPEHNGENFEQLVGQINMLAQNVPLAIQEKIRFLLVSVNNLFQALVERNSSSVAEAMLQINLLTSTRESQNLVREIALIARNIYNTLNSLSEGIALDNIAESTDGISEAAKKLKGVVVKLEEAAFHNLDQLEILSQRSKEDEQICDRILTGLRKSQQMLGELRETHPGYDAALNEIRDQLGDDLGAGAMALKNKFQENARSFLSLIANQGFQDLTGQTLKKTIEFIETLELQLVDLLQKYRPILGLTAQAGQPAQVAEPGQEAAPEAAPRLRQSQDQVDSLLADLGF